MTTPYEDLEQECADRLAPLVLAGTHVQVMPQTVAEYLKPPVDRPSVIVCYVGSNMDEMEGHGKPNMWATDVAMCTELLKVELTLRARSMRGVDGIHALRQKCQERLHGYQPANYSKLKARGVTFSGYLESVWVYKLLFVCDGLVVEVPDEVPEVLTTQITVDTITVQTNG